MQILGLKTGRRVDQQQGDIGAIERAHGAHGGPLVCRRARGNLATLANTRGVDEGDLTPCMQQRLVDGIAGCAGHRAHYRALTSNELVEEARLADVRPTDDRDGYLALDIGATRILWQRFESLNDDVKEVARTDAVLRAHRVESIKPKDGELLSGAIAFNVVRLIRNQDDRLTAAAQQLRNLRVARVRTGGCINEEKDQVGGINRDARLILHSNLNRIANRGLHAPRINHAEAHPIPLNDADQSIAGRASAIFNDRTSFTNKSIEQGALSDIRATDQRHQWEPAR